MAMNNNCINDGRHALREHFTINLTDPMLYDRLHTLSAEYSVPVELLVNLAVKRLIKDVDFTRDLRTGKIEGV